jgi:hypothetical protein
MHTFSFCPQMYGRQQMMHNAGGQIYESKRKYLSREKIIKYHYKKIFKDPYSRSFLTHHMAQRPYPTQGIAGPDAC